MQVTKRSDGYYLQIPVSVAGLSYKRVLPIATDFLELLNGAASLLIDSFRPVQLVLDAYYGVDQFGAVMHTVVPVGTAEMRCKAGHMTFALNGVPQPDSRTGKVAQIIDAAKASTAATDALSLVGRPSPTWSELYLVYELVEANTGRRMYDENWITRSVGNRFTRTANSYTALGRAGRHGKDSSQPPARPMSQREATLLMRTLVAKWLTNVEPESSSAG